MLSDFPVTIFGNCAPHKLPFSQMYIENLFIFINKHTNIYIFFHLHILI